MNLSTILPHINERRQGNLTRAVASLEAGIAAGVVPNTEFQFAKEVINNTVEEGTKNFLATGPHAQGHDMSDWWLAAYDVDALASGSHTLPAVLRRAKSGARGDLTQYAAFLADLMPLRDLLEQAKPLIAKKGDNRLPPKPKTPEQIEREANSMTCQCCGRQILANRGKIAHHGYERPGHGWQTGSCVGALELPFEVSRDRLGQMIDSWRAQRASMNTALMAVEAETAPVVVHVEDRKQQRDRYTGMYPTTVVEVTRATFDEQFKACERYFHDRRISAFDQLKASDVAERQIQVKRITSAIHEQKKRFDGWKQTHRREGDQWVAL